MPDRGKSTHAVARARAARAVTASLAVLLALVAASVALGAGGSGPLGSYIVVLKDSIDDPGAVGTAQTRRFGGQLGFVYRYGPIGYSATLPQDAVATLARDPRVRDVRIDHAGDRLGAQTPSTGVKRVFAFGNKSLQIDEKTNFTVNADVAVIDGGMKVESDLNVVKRAYCNESGGVSKCKDGEGDDEKDGHGTGVASVLGAVDNTEGVVGVAPGVRLWSVKVYDPGVTESEIVAGINYVTEHAAEIEVANFSTECLSLPCERKTAREAITKAVEAGVVFVVIAGNLNQEANKSDYASHPDVITVSGIADYDGIAGEKATSWWVPSCKPTKQAGDTGKVGEDDQRYANSNYGTVIDMTAPAVCIEMLAPGGGLVSASGTSYAAPEVAGAAAILAAQSNPNSKKDVEAIRATLLATGNTGWKDTSPDKVTEPLLDLSDETKFK
jgi:subtilisin family serine protease